MARRGKLESSSRKPHAHLLRPRPVSLCDKIIQRKPRWHPPDTRRSCFRKRYDGRPVPHHIWLGVSVEDAAHTSRIEHLKQINSDARFISFEPLLGPIGDVDLAGIAWAIVGGESGPRARPMDESWARQIRDICDRDEVAFFFKQWGGARPKSGGRLLDGEEWNGFPWQIVPEPIMRALQPEDV